MAIRNISISGDPSDNALLFLFTNFSSELWRPQRNRRFGTQIVSILAVRQCLSDSRLSQTQLHSAKQFTFLPDCVLHGPLVQKVSGVEFCQPSFPLKYKLVYMYISGKVYDDSILLCSNSCYRK